MSTPSPAPMPTREPPRPLWLRSAGPRHTLAVALLATAAAAAHEKPSTIARASAAVSRDCGTCAGTERASEPCQTDCPQVCGDGVCAGTESCTTCVQDCCGAQCTAGIPPYGPDYWNAGDVEPYNNCYNYSANVRTDTFAQPGRASGATCIESRCVTAASISAYAVNDGLIALPPGQTCPSSMATLALVIWPERDYHWYRRDADGRWSHKPGETSATNLDNAGQRIIDPATADRGPYTVFAGYFCTCSSSEQGLGALSIE